MKIKNLILVPLLFAFTSCDYNISINNIDDIGSASHCSVLAKQVTLYSNALDSTYFVRRYFYSYGEFHFFQKDGQLIPNNEKVKHEKVYLRLDYLEDVYEEVLKDIQRYNFYNDVLLFSYMGYNFYSNMKVDNDFVVFSDRIIIGRIGVFGVNNASHSLIFAGLEYYYDNEAQTFSNWNSVIQSFFNYF